MIIFRCQVYLLLLHFKQLKDKFFVHFLKQIIKIKLRLAVSLFYEIFFIYKND